MQRVLDLRTTPSPEPMGALPAQGDALAQGLAVAKVYAFVSIDYPGAAASWVFDGDGNDAVGGFGFDPLAPSTTPFGINDIGEIAGYYTDAGGNIHGFIYSAGAFSKVDVAGARHTFLTRHQNGGLITGACIDALNESHGLIGK
jgi:hypothetical protein